MRQQYSGVVLDWTVTSAFGKSSKCPREVVLTVWAFDEQEAHYSLHKIAEHQGYALGGVQQIGLAEQKTKERTQTRRNGAPEMTLAEKIARLEQLQAELSDI